MKSPLIKYKLFRERRSFDPVLLFKENNNLSYEEFKSILEKKGSMSPGESYFQRVKKHFEENHKAQQEKPEVVSEEKQEEVVPKENKSEDVSQNLQSKSKRKRKTKNEKEDIHKKNSLK